MFDHGERMYECILTACSSAEAKVWRSHLEQSITSQGKAVGDKASNVIQFHSPLTAEMKSIGAAFGRPSSFVRRMSVHRSATVGPTTDLNQVMIKNTQAVKETANTASSGSSQIPRSQSTATPSHVQTLAPRRVDRIKLESLLSDVWSAALPYPGMTVRRTDQLKGSADQIIRKLSIASLASSFHSTKRNGSYSSTTRLHRESEAGKGSTRSGRLPGTENKKPGRLPLSELLPADFDLQNNAGQHRRRNALRALTMTMERPFSPLLGSGESSLRRAQSVRDRHEIAARLPLSSMMATVEESRQQSGIHGRADETDMALDESKLQMAPPEAWSGVASMQATDGAEAFVCKKSKSRSRLRRLFG